MRIYKSLPKPKVDIDDEWYDPTAGETMTIFEQDESVQDTGLLDKRGHPIVAINQMNPIGFVRKF